MHETVEGIPADLTEMRRYADLPGSAWRCLKLIEEQAGVPVSLLSLGPDRDKTIVLDRRFAA